MATAAKSSSTKAQSAKTKSAKPRRTRRTGRRDPLAITLLKKDHREVEGWFDEYEQLEADSEKLALFNKIALALKVHTRIEEEIFYPEERGEVEDDMLDEAYVEHDGAKKLIAEIEAMQPATNSTTPRSRCWASTSSTTSRKRSSPAASSPRPRRATRISTPWASA
jgi:hypothetical protein